MTPGVKLDAQIARKVMGLACVKEFTSGLFILHRKGPKPKNDDARFFVPGYSTRMGAAWEVVEHMAEKYSCSVVLLDYIDPLTKERDWHCMFFKDTVRQSNICRAAIPAHAICLAALEAVKKSNKRKKKS